MLPPLPACCNPDVFAELSRIVQSLETLDGLVDAAATVSRQFVPEVTPSESQGQLWMMAETVRLRSSGAQPQGRLAHLHRHLFEELNFRGNSTDYYAAGNSYLPLVLSTRVGLPVTLGLIYRVVAERAGLKSWGIGLPGHFLVGVEADLHPMWIDVYSEGSVVTPAEAQLRVSKQFGKNVAWSEQYTKPVTNRYWITRILQNLLTAFGRVGQYEHMAATLEMELLLWPNEGRLHRDLAVVLARLGRQELAAQWLEHYLAEHPEDPQGSSLRHMLQSMA